MDGALRANPMRDLVMAFGFRDGGVVKSAAVGLATRLSMAMDERSAQCLLVLTAMRDGDRRRVTIWAFPRDQAFRLSSRGEEATIQVLNDVFSQKSKLRKVALCEGRELRTEFLQGRVLDYQADKGPQDVADFWIDRFLDCSLSVRDDAGTRMLATTIRKAVDACATLGEKEQILTAAMAIRTSPRRRWSLETFATEYLSGDVKSQFLNAAPNEDGRHSMFDFRRAEFESALAFRVFALESGVLVSSPLKEIGQSVKVSRGQSPQLSCRGTVVDEKLRVRHA